MALACLSAVFFFMGQPYSLIGLTLLTIFFVVIAAGNRLFGLLSMKSALWMGEISYSIYLVHGLVLWVVLQNALRRFCSRSSPTEFFLTAIAITPVVILVACGTFASVERPFKSLGRKLANRKRDKAASGRANTDITPRGLVHGRPYDAAN